jgi:hypothetical protein
MSDKELKATDEVALIKGMSKHLPEPQTNVRTVFELGAAYILYKAMRDVFKRA